MYVSCIGLYVEYTRRYFYINTVKLRAIFPVTINLKYLVKQLSTHALEVYFSCKGVHG